jgi:hypothetical protein
VPVICLEPSRWPKAFDTSIRVHYIVTIVKVAARSRTLNVFARSNTGIVVSNPTQGMHVCVHSVFVLGSGLATG